LEPGASPAMETNAQMSKALNTYRRESVGFAKILPRQNIGQGEKPGEFGNCCKDRGSRGNAAEVSFAPEPACSRRRLAVLDSTWVRRLCAIGMLNVISAAFAGHRGP